MGGNFKPVGRGDGGNGGCKKFNKKIVQCDDYNFLQMNTDSSPLLPSASAASAPIAPPQFVSWLRAVAPYIHAFRGKTFVVGLCGEAVKAGALHTIVQDLSLLHALGMRIILVHGFRPQVEEQLRLRGVASQFSHGLRITDPVSLECAKEAAGELRLDIEAAFSQGLPNTPMAHSAIKVVSGNLLSARPVGIVDGIDFMHTGVVRKIDTQTINMALSANAVVMLSPLGYSATGEAFNLSMEDVAAKVAIAFDADKLIYITEVPGVHDKSGKLLTEVSEDAAKQILSENYLSPEAAFYLRFALQACEGGVARAHILPFAMDGSVLLELFLHDGIGSMVVEETLEALREATIDDVGSILSIIAPLEADGTLVPRDRGSVERDIANFSVIEHDGILFGCAALNPYKEARMGEMACLAVNTQVQGQGDGERILRAIEQRAKAQGLEKIFVLTTRSAHWFLKRGFIVADVNALPASRQKTYNHQRKSQVLIKTLASNN
jgi:amino-acid N-acetyltransferase